MTQTPPEPVPGAPTGWHATSESDAVLEQIAAHGRSPEARESARAELERRRALPVKPPRTTTVADPQGPEPFVTLELPATVEGDEGEIDVDAWDPDPRLPDELLRDLVSVARHPLAARKAREALEDRLPRIVPMPDGSGEAVELEQLPDEEVLAYLQLGKNLKAKIDEHQLAARAELRRRADRRVKFSASKLAIPAESVRADDGIAREGKWSVPGPTAGEHTFDPEKVRDLITDLVAEGVLDAEAVADVAPRTLTLTFDVPHGADHVALLKAIAEGDHAFELYGVQLQLASHSVSEAVHLAAVKRIRKVPKVDQRFEALEIPVYPARNVSWSVK